MQGSKAMETIRWYVGKLELLVGGLSLALAMTMASLVARKRGTGQYLTPLSVAGAMAAGSAALLLFRSSRKVSRTASPTL